MPSPRYGELVVVRRWVRGNQAAWTRQEIHVIVQPGQVLLRRVGQVHLPDVTYATRELAEQAALQLIDESWTEAPADMSPKVRRDRSG